MAELAKNILGYLDSDSLRSAEQVRQSIGSVLADNLKKTNRKLSKTINRIAE